MSTVQSRRTPKVLIVEDQPEHAHLLRAALEECVPDVSCTILPDVPEALAYVAGQDSRTAATSPELVFLDMLLPSGSGLDVLGAIRHHPTLKSTPVLVLSCSEQVEHIKAAYALNVTGYINKPDGFPDLERTVKTIARFWLETATLPEKSGPRKYSA